MCDYVCLLHACVQNESVFCKCLCVCVEGHPTLFSWTMPLFQGSGSVSSLHCEGTAVSTVTVVCSGVGVLSGAGTGAGATGPSGVAAGGWGVLLGVTGPAEVPVAGLEAPESLWSGARSLFISVVTRTAF